MALQSWTYAVRFIATSAQAEAFIERTRHIADWSEPLKLEDRGEFRAGPAHEFMLHGTANDQVSGETLTSLCKEAGCEHVDTQQSKQ